MYVDTFGFSWLCGFLLLVMNDDDDDDLRMVIL